MNRTIKDAAALESTFPAYLRRTEEIDALSVIASGKLASLGTDNELLSIYTRIDRLPEGLLDILAEDFGVDWYDADAAVSVKRAQIASLFYVHRHKGTVSSVKQTLADLHEDCTLEEWFDYDGEPGYFRVKIVDPVGYDQRVMMQALDLSKKLSALLDSVFITETKAGHIDVASGSLEVLTEQVYLDITEGGS